MQLLLDKRIEEIKIWLDNNERSQAWLARKSGVSPETLNRILQGHREPKISTLEKITTIIK